MIRILESAFLVGVCAVFCLPAGRALAWGSTGHRIIGREAVLALPQDLPAFLRTQAAAETVGELAREPDRWKDAGATHDADRDPGHYLDMGDDGAIFGGPSLKALPPTRQAYETALRAVGADSWKAGYLPYSIIDGWQQLAKDLAYWRADVAGADEAADPAHRAWLAADGVERQALILRDLGTLAHYVGDGSQPLHVTIHFNGWGSFPNPGGYTQQHVHAFFEGEYVRGNVTAGAVRSAMAPYVDCRCDIAPWTSAYLAATSAQVLPYYDLQKAGGFAPGDARGRAFAAARLAAGASALRDLVVDAWRASANRRVGWPEVHVADVEAGRVDPFDSLYGID
ncbi:MAG TPA: S1/P1 Nuclease [Caulobacteraceae bacterium]|nr:S1/P1 Nuclease [Caulobacteraceae bacterium]